MRTIFLSLSFFALCAVSASAQSAKTAQKGTNPSSDAPVNISDPALRPASPATYSADPLPQNMKGQFYVKDDKPAYSDGTIVQPPTPQEIKERQIMEAIKKAGLAGKK
jgi:hypothetical protein